MIDGVRVIDGGNVQLKHCFDFLLFRRLSNRDTSLLVDGRIPMVRTIQRHLEQDLKQDNTHLAMSNDRLPRLRESQTGLQAAPLLL